MPTNTDAWKTVSSEKIKARDSLIPNEWKLKEPVPDSVLDVTSVPASCNILSVEELEITNTDAVGILANVHSGRWKAKDVTKAFCKRASIAQQLVRELLIY